MKISSLIGHTNELLSLIFQSDKPADSLIDVFFKSHKYLGSHDRKFIAETIYGLLRHLRKCEYVLSKAVNFLDIKLLEEQKIFFLIITYLYIVKKDFELNNEELQANIGNNSKEIFSFLHNNIKCYEKIEEADITSSLGINYSYPDWMVKSFVEQYGFSETEEILKALNEPAPFTIRVNTIKTNIDLCAKALAKDGIETQPTKISPIALNISKRLNLFSSKSFKDGLFEVQDEGSQLLTFLIDPKPNFKILDACAGAGGKALAFSAIMQNRGEIFATDINNYRLEQLKKRAKRVGSQNIRIKPITSLKDLQNKYSNYFDIVFVDAPCSGLGTIRRNPALKWTVTENTIAEISEKQKSILNDASKLVKQNGILAYATCTLIQKENEDVVNNFLLNNPFYQLTCLNDGLKKFNIINKANNKFLQLLPNINNTDGFFLAVLKKTDKSN